MLQQSFKDVVTKFIYTLRIMILHVALKTHYIPVVKDVTGFMLVVAGSHVISLAFFTSFSLTFVVFGYRWTLSSLPIIIQSCILQIVLIFSRRKTQIELIFVDQVFPFLIYKEIITIITDLLELRSLCQCWLWGVSQTSEQYFIVTILIHY